MQVLEEGCGAPPGCSAVQRRGGQASASGSNAGGQAGAAEGGEDEVLVAGPEAVYSYSPEEGRKAAYAIKGAPGPLRQWRWVNGRVDKLAELHCIRTVQVHWDGLQHVMAANHLCSW